jgi:hypothetical protein
MPAENGLGKFASRSDQEVWYNNSLGVAIEPKYAVGEYDIVILYAKDRKGLEAWLRYRVTYSKKSVFQQTIHDFPIVV